MMNWIGEFKAFIARGNVMDMTVGIIIGGAFTAIVNSLVEKIVNPLIVLLTGGAELGAGWVWQINEKTAVDFGAFIGAIINFLLIAFVVFWLVKTINSMKAKMTKEEAAVATPTCPACLEEVKEGAIKCSHCATQFDEPAVAK